MNIAYFIAGMIAGVILLLGVLLALAYRRDVVARKSRRCAATDARLVELSQRYFALIVSSDSISVARKLAAKADRIIDEAKQ